MRLALRAHYLHAAAWACVLHAQGVHPYPIPYLDPAIAGSTIGKVPIMLIGSCTHIAFPCSWMV